MTRISFHVIMGLDLRKETEMTELKKNIEKLALEQGKTELEIITTLQAVAAKTDNEELLEDLCDLKWDYL